MQKLRGLESLSFCLFARHTSKDDPNFWVLILPLSLLGPGHFAGVQLNLQPRYALQVKPAYGSSR